MKITPYDDQRECVDAIAKWCTQHPPNESCYVEMPTGSGKSVVIALFCTMLANLNKRVVVLCRSAELVKQNAERFQQVAGCKISVGIFCAGLGKKDYDCDVTFATIQSVKKHALTLGKINCILVDEAHQIPPRSDSQYGEFLTDIQQYNPKCRMVGLTATPYRLQGSAKSKLIHGEGQMFHGCAYAVSLNRMLSEKRITPWTVPSVSEVDVSSVKIRGGDFDLEEMSTEFIEKCGSNIDEILTLCNQRNKVLVFATTVAHAEAINNMLREANQSSMILTGETNKADRAKMISAFVSGKLKYLVNVGVLTTGFDAPNVDAIAVCRATQSPGLFYQIIGRGMRKAEGKDDFLILDFGGNFDRLGDPREVNFGRPEKVEMRQECGACHELVLHEDVRCPKCENVLRYRTCPNCQKMVPLDSKKCDKPLDPANLFSDICNFDFTVRRCWNQLPSGEKCTTILENEEIICPTCNAEKQRRLHGEFNARCAKKEPKPDPVDYKVLEIEYQYHQSKDPMKPSSMRVNYRVEPANEDQQGDLSRRKVSEWICFLHDGYARRKAHQWWKERSIQICPIDISEALHIANEGGLREPSVISVQKDGKYDRIVDYSDFRNEFPDPVYVEDAPF